MAGSRLLRVVTPLSFGVLLPLGSCTDRRAEAEEFVPPTEIWPGMTIRVERDPCPGAPERYLSFRWSDAVGEPPPVFSIGPHSAETFVTTDLVIPDKVNRGIAEFTLACYNDSVSPPSYLLEWTADILSEPPETTG
ncbi:MAG: hypothetical protein ABMA25_03950 [Ilumatobacteraceae bacterium]